MAGERYSDFIFTPSDLSEEVDLPLEVRKEILYLQAHIGRSDHWRMLGVPWNAPVEQVRAAYLEKVKVFHPDRHRGKRLGSFAGRLEKVFRALTEARDVLTEPALRADYVKKSATPEEWARLETSRLDFEARSAERRARIARSNPVFARAERVQMLVTRGKKAMEEGRYTQAANDFMTALGLDPRHREVLGLAEVAKRRASALKAQELYERALQTEAVGNHPAAYEAWQEAAEMDPSQPKYAIAAARAGLAFKDTEKARRFADQAVRAAPDDGRAFEVLGLVLQQEGDAKGARRALERALELDPGLETARAMVKKLRWSIFR